MHRYFSSPPVYAAPVASIDRENGIIRGITIARVGPAKGHGGFVDREFLIQLVDNASAKPAGIKARFGHPNMCSQALGTYLGRFKNYSYSGDHVKADLHLDDTAKTTPSGDLYAYVLNMADKNPDMFGASIVFEIGESVFLQEEVDGKTVKNEYFRLKELRATDIVDEPAATDGLFSVRLSGVEALPGIATQFLDQNPQIMELIFSKPDSVVEFLSNYLSSSQMTLSEKVKQNFAAFLAAFSLPEVPDQGVLEVDTLDTLFDAVSKSYPESFTIADNLTPIQKAEALTAFFSSVDEKLQLASTKLTETVTAFDSLTADHQALLLASEATASELLVSASELAEANTRIQELTGQLAARPTIPLNVTDPALSLSINQGKDETGKQILASMPPDIKRKLSSHPSTT
jgi:hypothetical protein